jgi:hypothetical protein
MRKLLKKTYHSGIVVGICLGCCTYTETNDTMMIPMKISRFFTANRIPAMSVGFFIGRIESYSMSLYKVKARIWVAKGLNDFESKDYPKTKKEFKN